MQAELQPHELMIRRASGRKTDLDNVTRLVDIGRPFVSAMSDRAATMVPWLKAHFEWHGLPWLLFARFKGESWIHCLASSDGFVPIDRLTDNKDLQVLAVSFDANENRTHARLFKKGSLAANLVATGSGDAPLEATSFASSVHPKTFLKRCKTVREALDAFCTALDARRRGLTAFSTRGSLELRDAQGRELSVDELDELQVTIYAEVTAAENPAAVRLQSAIKIGDLSAARQALADGASVEFLPDARVSPLSIALNYRCPGDWIGVAKALVDAGAPIDGYDWEDPPIFFWIGPLSRLSNQQGIIKGLQAAIVLGADINCPTRTLGRGSTPLHFAVQHSIPDVAQFLIDQGARLETRDANGFTPLELAESLARRDPPFDLTSDAAENETSIVEEDQKLSLQNFIVAQHSGNEDDDVRRRAQILRILRRASLSKPSS
jgi:hypothetical protein